MTKKYNKKKNKNTDQDRVASRILKGLTIIFEMRNELYAGDIVDVTQRGVIIHTGDLIDFLKVVEIRKMWDVDRMFYMNPAEDLTLARKRRNIYIEVDKTLILEELEEERMNKDSYYS